MQSICISNYVFKGNGQMQLNHFHCVFLPSQIAINLPNI